LARQTIVRPASTRSLSFVVSPSSCDDDRQDEIGHTFHGVASLPLELCRVTTELIVCAED
jgi:hypothetical protein